MTRQWAAVAVVAAVVAISATVHAWETRKRRRTPEQQAFIDRLHESARDFPTTDDDGLTCEWGWR
ncbi:hypothetical protein AB0C10_36965 [Microbispora amethystogenes]|uniref:hypothetical protein n=1 Tax=Microbispora amethystogenes TaxID=1427754 RepID=UPI0033DCD7D8